MKKGGILQPLGLDIKTEQTYRALLSLADAPASAVARRIGMRRTSVYHILENLASMGLVSMYIERGVKRFVAEHPSRLKTFFERQTLLAERTAEELKKEMSTRSPSAPFRAIEGTEAIKNATEEALLAKEKIIYSIGSSQKLLSLVGGKFGFGARRRKQKIFQRALRFADDSPISSPERLHDVRILPETFKFPGYILMFDTSVIMISFDEPPRGIIAKDRNFATMMRSLFETIWNYSSPLRQ